jgi:hypothetical protein
MLHRRVRSLDLRFTHGGLVVDELPAELLHVRHSLGLTRGHGLRRAGLVARGLTRPFPCPAFRSAPHAP